MIGDLTAQHGVPLDDDLIANLIDNCRKADDEAIIQEILHVLRQEIPRLARRRNVDNFPGLLLTTVAAYFKPPRTELTRYRHLKIQERAQYKAILDDPDSPEDHRKWAMQQLSGRPSGAGK